MPFSSGGLALPTPCRNLLWGGAKVAPSTADDSSGASRLLAWRRRSFVGTKIDGVRVILGTAPSFTSYLVRQSAASGIRGEVFSGVYSPRIQSPSQFRGVRTLSRWCIASPRQPCFCHVLQGFDLKPGRFAFYSPAGLRRIRIGLGRDWLNTGHRTQSKRRNERRKGIDMPMAGAGRKANLARAGGVLGNMRWSVPPRCNAVFCLVRATREGSTPSLSELAFFFCRD